MTGRPDSDGPDGDEQQPAGVPGLFVRRIDGAAAREPGLRRPSVDLATATTRDGEVAADLSHLTLQGLAERALSGGDGEPEGRDVATPAAAVSDVLGADPSTGDRSPPANRRSRETVSSASADRPPRDPGKTGEPADGRGSSPRRPGPGGHTGGPGGNPRAAGGPLPGDAAGDRPEVTSGRRAGASRPGDAGSARGDAGKARSARHDAADTGRARSPADDRGPPADARDREPTSPPSVAARAGSDERPVDDLYRELRRRERIERERRGLDERE
jgi:hypothetical protein